MKRDDLSSLRVILLSGEEFQRHERLHEIIESSVDPATRDFNLDILTPETFDYEKFAELIMTYPLMAVRRTVIMKDFDVLPKDIVKKACEIIQKTPETTLVVVEGEDAKLSPKPPAKLFRAESFKQIYENNLPKWVQMRFIKRGKKATPKAIALLINNIGDSLGELDNEIEKVVITVQDKENVSETEVARVVGPFKRDTVWNFCNAIGLNDFSNAIRILRNLMNTEKNKETVYLSALTSHLMKITEYTNQVQSGISPDEAMSSISTTRFFWNLNKMDTQVKNVRYESARRAITAIGRTESIIKKYSVDKSLMMELMIPFILPGRVKTV